MDTFTSENKDLFMAISDDFNRKNIFAHNQDTLKPHDKWVVPPKLRRRKKFKPEHLNFFWRFCHKFSQSRSNFHSFMMAEGKFLASINDIFMKRKFFPSKESEEKSELAKPLNVKGKFICLQWDENCLRKGKNCWSAITLGVKAVCSVAYLKML